MGTISTTTKNQDNEQKIYDEALSARTELYKAKNKAIVKSDQLDRKLIVEYGVVLCSLLICIFGLWTTITPYFGVTSLQKDGFSERLLEKNSNGFSGGGIPNNSDEFQKISESNLKVRELSQDLVANGWIMGSLGIIAVVSISMMSDQTKKLQLRRKINTANEVLSELDEELFGI
ncbi:MAG: hypothetical protein AB4062_02055 [Crocosphaera sp.]